MDRGHCYVNVVYVQRESVGVKRRCERMYDVKRSTDVVS